MLNEREKFRAKLFLHYTDICVIFVFSYFILTHPVHVQNKFTLLVRRIIST